MYLRYLEVWNFLNHEHEVLVLPREGVFFVDGASGNGKSALLVDAPNFALFGFRATRSGQKGMTLNDLRHKRHKDERMAVRVIYEFDTGEVMVIERGIDERNASYAILEENWLEPDGSYRWPENRVVDQGAAPVERLVRTKLGGMSWQQLTAAFVARQSEIALLSQKKGSDRQQLVHRLMGVRELELAEKEMALRKKRAEDELKLVVAQIGSRTREGELGRVRGLRQQLADASARVQAVEAELAELRSRREALDGEIAPMRQALHAQGEIERLQAAIAARTVEIETLTEKAGRHDDATALVASLADLPAQITDAEAERTRLADGYQRLQAADKIAEELQQACARLTQVRELATVGGGGAATDDADEELLSIAQIDQRLAAIDAEKRHLKADGERRSGELVRMREEGACFTCGRPLDAEHDHSGTLESLQEALDELRGQYAALAREEQTLRDEIPAARQRDDDRAEAERELVRAEESLRGVEKRQEELDLDALPSKEEIVEQGTTAKERVEELKRKQIELGVAQRELDPQASTRLATKQAEQTTDTEALTAARAAAELTVDRTKLGELEAEREQVGGEISRRDGQLPELQAATAKAQTELEAAEADYRVFGALLESREAKSADASDYRYLAAGLKAFTKALAEEIRPSLEEMASEMLYHITNGIFSRVLIDENYELSVVDDEGELTKIQGVSGGEDVRTNLALRLALTRLVSQRTGVPVGFLILDEPFRGLDDGHIEAAMEVLGALKPFYKQIFLLSHDGDLASSQHVDFRISVETRKGRDRVRLYQR